MRVNCLQSGGEEKTINNPIYIKENSHGRVDSEGIVGWPNTFKGRPYSHITYLLSYCYLFNIINIRSGDIIIF